VGAEQPPQSGIVVASQRLGSLRAHSLGLLPAALTSPPPALLRHMATSLVSLARETRILALTHSIHTGTAPAWEMVPRFLTNVTFGLILFGSNGKR
jgi:hypothetical protein